MLKTLPKTPWRVECRERTATGWTTRWALRFWLRLTAVRAYTAALDEAAVRQLDVTPHGSHRLVLLGPDRTSGGAR